MMVIDYASNYPECLLTTDIHSSRIIQWLKEVFSHLGNPDELVSDNGPQFISSEFAGFLAEHRISHICSAMYNPSENSLVEVFNRVLKYGVQSFSFQECISWEEGIHELLKANSAALPKPDTWSPANLFFQHPFHLDFQPMRPVSETRLNVQKLAGSSREVIHMAVP